MRELAGTKILIANPYLFKTILNKYGCTVETTCDESGILKKLQSP